MIVDTEYTTNPEFKQKMVETMSVSNKETLKNKIHDIHNYLRNNGAGYGMNALKVFNVIYGLKKIEEYGLLDTVKLSHTCKFSYLLELANDSKDDELTEKILHDVLDSISVSDVRDLLFYEIPKNIKSSAFSYLVKEIDKITIIEKTCNVLLSGKIYEYFIGRDQTAISELGAYFTDRHIVDFIFGKLDPTIYEDGSIPTMIDMFGGSGGFTTGYINYINNKYKDWVKWGDEINNIHHYDMNEDVIKSAGLEFFCLTGVLPNMGNLKYKNSFTDEFGDKKFTYVVTNPPYGGDKTKTTAEQEKRAKIKNYIKSLLPNITDESVRNERLAQLKEIEVAERNEKQEKEKTKVTVETSSNRIQRFAKKHKLKGNDKEAASLILLMDLVDDEGTVIGVLKEGVYFDKKYKDLRKCLVQQFNVREVISVPSDQFENTSTKTSIIVFDNSTDKTSQVVFSEIVVEKYKDDVFEEQHNRILLKENKGDIKCVCEQHIATASRDDILGNGICSLNGKDYKNKENIYFCNEEYEMVKLGDICELQNGKQLNKNNIINGIYPVYGGGSIPVGYHNDYNSENATIVAGTGNCCGFVQFDNNKFWASQCFTIKSQNEIINKYLFIICKSLEHMFMNSCSGSAQKFIRASQFKDMSIPVPKSQNKMLVWVEKISKPYNEKHEKQKKVEELELYVKSKIKEICENEECQEVKLGDICEFKNGKNLTRNAITDSTGEYYVIGGGIHPFGKYNKYNRNENTILCSSSGANAGYISKYTTKIWASDCFSIALKHNSAISNDYLYHVLKLNQHQIYNLQTGSAQPHVYSKDLISCPIRIPKNKHSMYNLENIFQEIETLKQDITNADILYKQYINELGEEATPKKENYSSSSLSNI
jgi:restriction endonuclease S subunit/type I restriction-modification system DNA methylase subunit